MTRTKVAHVRSVARRCVLSKARSAEIVDTLLEIMKQALEQGDEVTVRGFGKFRVCGRNGLKPRSPGTAFFLPSGARRVVTFRCSPVLEKRING